MCIYYSTIIPVRRYINGDLCFRVGKRFLNLFDNRMICRIESKTVHLRVENL